MRHLEPSFRLHLADDDEPQPRPSSFSQLVGDALADYARDMRARQHPERQLVDPATTKDRGQQSPASRGAEKIAIIREHGRQHGEKERARKRGKP